MKLFALNIDNTTVSVPAGIPQGGLNSGSVSLTKILSTGVGIMLVIAAILALLYAIWGGFSWITSGGDAAKIKAARQAIIYALIGLFVAFAAFMIINVVGQLFQVNLFQ